MVADPITIFFRTELKWPAIDELKVERSVVRQLYNTLSETGEPRYQNCKLQGDCPTLSSDHEDGHSICQFSPDSIIFEEIGGDMRIDLFGKIVENVLGSLNEDDIPSFILQRCRFQCVAQPKHYRPLELLASKVAHVYDRIDPFERPPDYFGVRFRFPAVNMVLDESEADEGEANTCSQEGSEEGDPKVVPLEDFTSLRIEVYGKDPELLWMEVASSYLQTDRPLLLANADKMLQNICKAHTFLTENVVRFLNQYDVESNPQDE